MVVHNNNISNPAQNSASGYLQGSAVFGAFVSLRRRPRPFHGELVGAVAAELASNVAVALVSRVHAVKLEAPSPLAAKHVAIADADPTRYLAQIRNAILPAFPPFLYPPGYSPLDGKSNFCKNILSRIFYTQYRLIRLDRISFHL